MEDALKKIYYRSETYFSGLQYLLSARNYNKYSYESIIGERSILTLRYGREFNCFKVNVSLNISYDCSIQQLHTIGGNISRSDKSEKINIVYFLNNEAKNIGFDNYYFKKYGKSYNEQIDGMKTFFCNTIYNSELLDVLKGEIWFSGYDPYYNTR